MRILVTRGRDEAARTAEKLTNSGHQVILSPVIDMCPTGARWPEGIADAVIATSAAAFDLAEFPGDYPLAEVRRLLRLFVVGEKTVDAARRCGFCGAMHVAPDAKELVGEIVKTVTAPARLVYLAGHDRKADLEICCRDAGLTVEAIEIYEARAAKQLTPEAVTAFAHDEIDVVLHYSRRSAEIFLDLATAAKVNLSAVRQVAISADAAAPLHAAGCQHIAIATEPKELAILTLLSDIAKSETQQAIESIRAATELLKGLSAYS